MLRPAPDKAIAPTGRMPEPCASLMMKLLECKAQVAGFRRADVIATPTGAPLYRALGYRELGKPSVALPNGLRLPAVYPEKRLAPLH